MTADMHPGEFRHCIRPDCDASFNIVAMYSGKERVEGWRHVHLLIGYLCPVHGSQVMDGGHLPRWLDRDAPMGMTGVTCGCGAWEWRPGKPSNLGQHRDQWVAHLMAIDPIPCNTHPEGKR